MKRFLLVLADDANADSTLKEATEKGFTVVADLSTVGIAIVDGPDNGYDALMKVTGVEAVEEERVSSTRSPDPVHEKEGKWWFWDETWAYEHGPYDTEESARIHLLDYARTL